MGTSSVSNGIVTVSVCVTVVIGVRASKFVGIGSVPGLAVKSRVAVDLSAIASRATSIPDQNSIESWVAVTQVTPRLR